MVTDWHGLTGAQVREIMTDILSRAETAAGTIQELTEGSNTFLPSTILGYYDNGDDEFYSDEEKKKLITGEKGKIYYDLESLPDAYYYNDGNYYKINNPADIQIRLDSFNTDKSKTEGTIENEISKKVTTSDFENYKTEQEKHNNQLQIVSKLDESELKPTKEQLFFLTNDTYLKNGIKTYSRGLYSYDTNEGKFQRVGGLL